jgi:hypothetical protein
MSLISEGIENVTARELPAGIRQDGEYVAAPRIALVRWRSSHSDMLHQVYVNGRFAGATIDAEQRQMIVQIPGSFESAVRIEVFAVPAEQAHVDFGSEIAQPPVDSGRVKISLLRSQNLPAGATANVFYDAGSGEIDYDQPLNDCPIQIWPSWMDKAGFAMAGFGIGDFGWDSAAAVGFGKGIFGGDAFGLDADTLEWISQALPAGAYKFGVRVLDQAGNESAASEVGPVTVTPAARAAEGLTILSFNAQTNELVLQIQ